MASLLSKSIHPPSLSLWMWTIGDQRSYTEPPECGPNLSICPNTTYSFDNHPSKSVHTYQFPEMEQTSLYSPPQPPHPECMTSHNLSSNHLLPTHRLLPTYLLPPLPQLPLQRPKIIDNRPPPLPLLLAHPALQRQPRPILIAHPQHPRNRSLNPRNPCSRFPQVSVTSWNKSNETLRTQPT